MYGRTLETETLIIPYNKMSLSLLFLTMPVAAGMLFNSKFPKFAPFLTKVFYCLKYLFVFIIIDFINQVGTVAGFGIIIVCQTLEVFIFPDIFIDVPLKLYVGEFLLPILGLALGFITSSLFRLKYSIRRTIAIECGIQNVGTALTIVSLSFPFDVRNDLILFTNSLFFFKAIKKSLVISLFVCFYNVSSLHCNCICLSNGKKNICKIIGHQSKHNRKSTKLQNSR